MKTPFVQFWKRFWPPLFLLGSLVFIVQYFHHQAIHISAPVNFVWQYVLLGAILQFAYWIINTLCWQSTILWYGKIKLGLLQSFSQSAMVTLGKYFPGKIWGMVARASALAQLGVNTGDSLYATLSEQCLILYSACLSSAALLSVIDTSLFSVALAIATALAAPLLVPIQKWGLRFAPRILPLRTSHGGPQPTALNLYKIAALSAAYSMGWLLLGTIFCCIYYVLFPSQPSPTTIARLIIANTIGISIGFFAVFSPGGLGIREAITSSLLAAQMGLEQAVLLCLIYRLWIVAFELISGLALLIPQKSPETK